MRSSNKPKAVLQYYGLALIMAAAIGSIALFLSHRNTPELKTAHIGQNTARPSLGKIAVIIDDLGYNLKICDYLKNIDGPLSVSILPDLKYSASVAACAGAFKKEVLMHLPLEPHITKNEYPENYIITTEMNMPTVTRILAKALRSVPNTLGVTNHMGSKATENKKLMKAIFLQLKRRGLFFVDNLVSTKSICFETAKETNIGFAQRDVFLDNNHDRRYIEGQFAELAQTAKEQGYAIGVGHPHEITLKILKEQLKKLKKQGFEITTVQNIIRKP